MPNKVGVCPECERTTELLPTWCRACRRFEYLFCADCLGAMYLAEAMIQEEGVAHAMLTGRLRRDDLGFPG